MNPLQSRKQRLVAEAAVQRQLLGADVERLVRQADGWRRQFVSVRAFASAGFSAASFFGLFRGRGSDGKASLLSRLFRWARAGWAFWSAMRPGVARDEVAEALEALRQAERAARQGPSVKPR